MIYGELLRYVIAGALAFGCDVAVLYIATDLLAVHYLLSNVFGYFVGLTVSYYLSVTWVFTHRRYQKKTLLEFAMFTTIVLVGLGLSELIMYFIVGLGGVYYLYAKVVASVVVALYSYTAKKLILFRPAPGTLDV